MIFSEEHLFELHVSKILPGEPHIKWHISRLQDEKFKPKILEMIVKSKYAFN
jgi:hypothetical protein